MPPDRLFTKMERRPVHELAEEYDLSLPETQRPLDCGRL